MVTVLQYIGGYFYRIGNAIFFIGEVLGLIVTGRVRWGEVLKQIFEQGIQSLLIIMMTSFASGVVLALSGYVMMKRFGATEYIAQLVALSLVRELGPVFTSLIFSGKSGARITAELGTMSVNDQLQATRMMGVDPLEYFVVPRVVACLLALPILVVVSELVGILGGYIVGISEANIPSAYYIDSTLRSIGFVDFFSGLIKAIFFSVIIAWVCCYQGFNTRGGSLGVGRFTTRAVAYSYIFVIVSNTILTKIILTVWGVR